MTTLVFLLFIDKIPIDWKITNFSLYVATCNICTAGPPNKVRPSVKVSLPGDSRHRGKKHPDCLADSCKQMSVYQMAAGLRLSRCNHGFSSFLNLSNMFFSIIFEQVVGLSVLKTFSFEL